MGDHLWKQCADWLCRLEVLPANHRIMWPDATIQDLAYTLRDGVLLCHIAATLDPSSIDQRNVNQRPQMAQFLCLKNIRAFLHACSGVFGIKETDLFQPSMLYDYSGTLYKTVCTWNKNTENPTIYIYYWIHFELNLKYYFEILF